MENLLTCNFVKYIIYYKIIHVMFFTVLKFLLLLRKYLSTQIGSNKQAVDLEVLSSRLVMSFYWSVFCCFVRDLFVGDKFFKRKIYL